MVLEILTCIRLKCKKGVSLFVCLVWLFPIGKKNVSCSWPKCSVFSLFSLFSRHCHVSLQKLYVPLTLFQKAGHAPIPTVSFWNRKLISMLCWGLAGYSNSWSLDQAKLHGTTLNPLFFMEQKSLYLQDTLSCYT